MSLCKVYAIFIAMNYRSFIAIEVPQKVQTAIFKMTSNLQQVYPIPIVRWVPEENIHLTLKFLGDIPAQKLERLAQSFAVETEQMPSFTLEFSETGVFPNLRKPRIMWIGLKKHPELENLYKVIESTSLVNGFPAEERPFSPHITLGRISDRFPLSELQKLCRDFCTLEAGTIDPIVINSIKVFKSDLKPNGPVYTLIHSVPFKGIQSKKESSTHA